jgi:rhodanese-related sulfurtransferase
LDLARYLVDAVVVEKRSCREVARAHGVSKSWVAKLVARFKEDYEAITPRSKAAHRVANRSSDELEERVVRIRKELAEAGFDCGAQTIHYPSKNTRRATSPGAISIPLEELKRRIKELPKSEQIVAYCRGPLCALAPEATRYLESKGYRVKRAGRRGPLTGMPRVCHSRKRETKSKSEARRSSLRAQQGALCQGHCCRGHVQKGSARPIRVRQLGNQRHLMVSSRLVRS